MRKGEVIEDHVVVCDGCGGVRHASVIEGRDYRFGGRETYRVVECQRCGLAFVSPPPTQEALNQLYSAEYVPYEGQSNHEFSRMWRRIKSRLVPAYARLLGNYIHDIPLAGDVLDIGCGNGLILAIALARGLRAVGVEPNPPTAQACLRQGFEVYVGTLETARLPEAAFDTVVLSQVLEHVRSPTATLREVFRVTKPGGRVYVYVPNYDSWLRWLFGRYWHGWHLPFHLYQFNFSTLSAIAQMAGFRVSRVGYITPTHFLIVSLKSALWGRDETPHSRPVDRGRFLERVPVRIALSLALRALDPLVGDRGDCLMAELSR